LAALATSTTVSATPASAMPAEPTSSSGLRPALSMRYMATTVASTLMTPAAMVPYTALLMPASWKKLVLKKKTALMPLS
jgi:hypothetical protein